MTINTIDPRTALVLIDLQCGITALPTVHSADDVVHTAQRLVTAWHDRSMPVIAFHVDHREDDGDYLSNHTDVAEPPVPQSPDFAELRPELGLAPSDLSITKRGWNAFYGTELDLQLRRRKITGIVLAGIATSSGVESTARAGAERGYEIAVATDAVTDTNALAHTASVEVMLPRLGQLDTADSIIAALES